MTHTLSEPDGQYTQPLMMCHVLFGSFSAETARLLAQAGMAGTDLTAFATDSPLPSANDIDGGWHKPGILDAGAQEWRHVSHD